MATTKNKSPPKGGSTKATRKKPSPKRQTKEKFDTEAFVFETDTEVVVEALERLYAIDEDDHEYPYTNDELYWLAYWCDKIPIIKERNIKSLPLCAKEAKVLGIYKNKLIPLKRG